MKRDDCYCAQEGWTQTETSPDVWAESVDCDAPELFGDRAEWPPPGKVEKPPHYTHGEREAIDYMRDIGVLEHYCVGNIFKYLYRYKHKDNPTEDLLKARQYIDILVKEIQDA